VASDIVSVLLIAKPVDSATEQYMMLPLAWQPFAKGGARVCYKARQLHRDGSTTLSVAKMFMTPHPREDYFNECMIQVRS
jgi:hypothetical protein